MLTQLPDLARDFSLSKLLHVIVHSGIVFYGGLFGLLFLLKLYAKRSKYSRETLLNMIAPAVPLFHGFGRIGCLLAGCCYGVELRTRTELFNMITIDRLPIQVFEALFEFLLFFALVIVERKKSYANLLRIYLLSYALFRFACEFFRGDILRGIFLGLSTSQWISILVLIYYLISFIRNSRAKKLNAEQ